MLQPLLSHLDRTVVVRHQKLRVLNAATPVNVDHSHHWLHSLWTHDAFWCQCISQFLCWDHSIIVHVHFSEYLYQHLLLFVCQELACNESLYDCLELVFEPKSMKVVDDLFFLRWPRCVILWIVNIGKKPVIEQLNGGGPLINFFRQHQLYNLLAIRASLFPHRPLKLCLRS